VPIISSPLKESEMHLLKEGQYGFTDRYAVVLNTEKREDDRRYREQKIGAAMKELERQNTEASDSHVLQQGLFIFNPVFYLRSCLGGDGNRA
jgi:hypothetical protein